MTNLELQRRLFFQQENGEVQQGQVIFRLVDKQTEWQCHVKVLGIPVHMSNEFYSCGVDAIQALLLGFKNAAFHFEETRLYTTCTIWFSKPGDDGALTLEKY